MYDPIMIYGFSVVHLVVPMVVFGFVFPSWFNWIVPFEKIPFGDKPVAPMETIDSSQDITRAVSEEGNISHRDLGEEYKR